MGFRNLVWVIALGLAACGGGGGGDGGTGSGGGGSGGGGSGGGGDGGGGDSVTTLEFEVEDFSEVAVRNSWVVSLREGADYRVEVTVDEQYANLVAVEKQGVRVRIGYREDFTGDIRARTEEVVVTMPALTVLELNNSARATMTGFGGSSLELALSGSSQLDGADNRFDFLSANQNGSSQLRLREFEPVPAAHVELGGSSLAIVNMANGGTLTGALSGDAHLSYYGSNLSLGVTTSNTASMTRLGDARP